MKSQQSFFFKEDKELTEAPIVELLKHKKMGLWKISPPG
jgi:hypothetical protein